MAPTVEIVVRRGAGRAVLAGPVPACPAGRAVVAVPGGEVHLDPAAPDEPPLLMLREPAEVGPVVAELFGPRAAEVIGPASGDPVTVPWNPGPGWDAVRRVGLVRWLRRHGPDVLPDALLDLEEGTAATSVELADEELATAERLLGATAPTAARLSAMLREPGLPDPPAGLPELLAAAVDAALRWAPVDASTATDLRHERELAVALSRFGAAGGPINWSELAGVPEIGDRELAAATSAGGSAAGVGRQGSVDWYQVPRGVLDTAEGTVTWTVGGDMIEVTVRARPGGPDCATLAFRVYAPDDPFPLGRSALYRSTDGTWFGGSTRLRPTALPADRLIVDVFDAGDRRRPRMGVDAVRARALRWAARGVTLVRLTGAAGVAGDVAAEALREAEALHDEVAEDHPDSARRDQSLRCAARCAALRGAVLARAGQERQATALQRLWEVVDAPVTAADVAVPGLGGPGWRSLVAERAPASGRMWWG